MTNRKAEMGLFVCLTKPSPKMIEAANEAGTSYYEFAGTKYPRAHIITVAELLSGERPQMPTPINPYQQAKKVKNQAAPVRLTARRALPSADDLSSPALSGRGSVVASCLVRAYLDA